MVDRRFFLPALPLLLVSMIAVDLLAAAHPCRPALRVFGAIALGTFLVSHELRFAHQ